MRTITGSDTSILVYLASVPNIRVAERQKLVAKLSDDAREIAEAVKVEHLRRRRNSPGKKSPLNRTARTLVSWARGV
jgi:hypothetical protein